VEHAIRFITRHREEYAQRLKERGSSPLDSLKAEKLGIEIEISRERLRLIRRESISITEMRQTLHEHAAIVTTALDGWQSTAVAQASTPAAADAVDELVRQVRQRLSDACAAAGD
jgi:hypothetical protein